MEGLQVCDNACYVTYGIVHYMHGWATQLTLSLILYCYLFSPFVYFPLCSIPRPDLHCILFLVMSVYNMNISLSTSAILYLNGDIEGGEFFFAHSPKDLSPQVSHQY